MDNNNHNCSIITYSHLPDTRELVSAPKHGRSYMFNLLSIDIREFNQFLIKLHADLPKSRNMPIIHAVYDSDHMFKVEGMYDEYNHVFNNGAYLYEVEQVNKNFDTTVEQAKEMLEKVGFTVQIEEGSKVPQDIKT